MARAIEMAFVRAPIKLTTAPLHSAFCWKLPVALRLGRSTKNLPGTPRVDVFWKCLSKLNWRCWKKNTILPHSNSPTSSQLPVVVLFWWRRLGIPQLDPQQQAVTKPLGFAKPRPLLLFPTTLLQAKKLKKVPFWHLGGKSDNSFHQKTHVANNHSS